MEFWLANERPADQARAEQTCEPQGYQFEFSGEGTGTVGGDAVQVVWQYWGLLCQGSEEWKIWEEYVMRGRTEAHTGPPGDDASVPMLATFGDDGSMSSVSHEFFGGTLPPNASGEAETLGGTLFGLSPGDAPTTVDAEVPAGATRIPCPLRWKQRMDRSKIANPLARRSRPGSLSKLPAYCCQPISLIRRLRVRADPTLLTRPAP